MPNGQQENAAATVETRLLILIQISLFYYMQGGKQATCALPEVFGDGTLDLRMHWEAEICAPTVKNSRAEKETQGQ